MDCILYLISNQSLNKCNFNVGNSNVNCGFELGTPFNRVGFGSRKQTWRAEVLRQNESGAAGWRASTGKQRSGKVHVPGLFSVIRVAISSKSASFSEQASLHWQFKCVRSRRKLACKNCTQFRLIPYV